MDWLSSIVGRPLCLIALEGNCKGVFQTPEGEAFRIPDERN